MGSDVRHGREGRPLRLIHITDDWLDRHIPSMYHDLHSMLQSRIEYDLKADATTSEEDSEKALRLALAS